MVVITPEADQLNSVLIPKLGQGDFLSARRIGTGSGFEHAGGTPPPISKANTPPPPPDVRADHIEESPVLEPPPPQCENHADATTEHIFIEVCGMKNGLL